MFDNEVSGKTKGDWTMNSNLDSKQICVMNHMEKVVCDVLNAYNEENNIEERIYNYSLPGIVKTGHAQNLVLHLDSMNPDYDDPYNELIVHIPVVKKGQWL